MRAAPGGYRGTGWGWRHDCPRRDPPSRWRRIARHHRAATAWLPELAKCCQNNVTRIACMYCGRGPNFRTRPIIIIKSYRNERLRTPTPSASPRKSRKPAGVQDEGYRGRACAGGRRRTSRLAGAAVCRRIGSPRALDAADWPTAGRYPLP
jgi:hypothetical protein